MRTGSLSRSGAPGARTDGAETGEPAPARLESLESRTLLAVTDPFTAVVLPDTQIYAWKHPEIFHAQTQWIAANTAPQNIRFLTHVGDVVENPASSTEWARADAAIDALDTVPLPYSIAIGNHDYDGSSTSNFVKNFGEARYEGRSWYGDASSNQLSHWQIFSGGPWNFLHIALEYKAPASAIEWAQSIIDAHPGLPTWITTHDYISTSLNRSSTGNRIWEELVRGNPQVFIVTNGHYTGEAHRIVNNDAGLPVIEMVVDFQGHTNGGNGYLRLLEFIPLENRIEGSTYSPHLDSSYTDDNSQFSITLDFASRFGPPLGTNFVSAEEVLVPQRPQFSTRRIAPPRRPVELLDLRSE